MKCYYPLKNITEDRPAKSKAQFPANTFNVLLLLLCSTSLFAQNKPVLPHSVSCTPGHIIIKLKKGVLPRPAIKNNIAALGITNIDLLQTRYHCVSAKKISSDKKSYTYRLDFLNPVDISAAVKDYNNSGACAYAEPDYVCSNESTTPNDPLLGLQWSLYNNGSFAYASPVTSGADIKMKQAWDITQGSSSVVVAVIDAGAKLDHPEFAGRIWTNTAEIPGNGIDDDGNGYIDDCNGWNFVSSGNNPTDDNSHGTNVTGIIGANGNNGIGYAGIDWNCKLMILKTQNNLGSGTYSAIIEAIYYATDNGAKVINMSLGSGAISSALQDAVDYAYAHSVTVVAAIGNSNSGAPFYPAACNHVIAVGATTAADKRTYYSNYGSYLTVVAPGDVIYGLWYLSDTDYSHAMSGTSMAAPHVTGLAALLLAQSATRTPDDIRTILQTTSDDQVGDPSEDVVGWDQYYGYGRINAYRALTYCPTPFISSITGAGLVCAGYTSAFTDTVSGGAWSNSDASIATISAAGIVTGIATGTTTISYSKSNSCGVASAVKVVTVNTTPASISGGTDVCVGSSITFTNALPMGTWSSSNTLMATAGSTITGDGLITGITAGTATITYTTGCGTPAVKPVTVNLTPAAITGTRALCSSATAALACSTPAGSWAAANGNATINAASGLVTGITPGTVAVSYSLATGCRSTSIVTVNGFTEMSTVAPIITTIAGNGTSGYSGNGGPATAAQLSVPWGIAINNTTGQIYIADFSYSTIRKVDLATGTISTFAGLPGGGFGGDGGPATAARFISPTGLSIDDAGNLYFADLGNSRVRKVNTSGIITTVAGNGTPGYIGDGGPATAANISSMNGLGVDGAGNIFIPDYTNHTVRKVNAATGIITTIAGLTSLPGYTGDGAAATAAKLNGPNDVFPDNTGNYYISDRNNDVIRKISATGNITTFAGNGAYSYTGDGGPATAASFRWASGFDLDCTGALIFCDVNNNVIRKIAASGNITTIAGTGIAGYTGDGASATAAKLNAPVKIIHDAIGNLYFSELNNNTLRKIVMTKKVCVGNTTSFCSTTGTGTWSSSNTSIATVSSAGVVTGIAAGTATISLTLPAGYSVTASLIVNPLLTPISGSMVVCTGNTTTLHNATGCGTWTCSPSAVATISGTGVLTGITSGTAIVTYTGVCGFVTATVTVNSTAPAAISGASTICLGGTTTLTNTVTGGTWASSASSVASIGVTTGVVTATGSGIATITYSNGCGTATTKTITTNAPVAPITGTTNLCIAGTATLTDADPSGTWSSANTTIAAVGSSSGIITGNSAGTAYITYTLSTGCINFTTVTIDTLAAGTLSGPVAVPAASVIALLPSLAGGTWASSNPLAALVGSAGTVTGVAVGSAVISYFVTNSCGTSYVTRPLNVTPVLLDTCSSWAIAGHAGVSGGQSDYMSIAINTAGTPYIAYRDAANGNKATVMKFAGGNWVNVGTPGLSAGSANWLSIAIDATGTPYVAYRDIVNGSAGTVMKFDGTSWTSVGSIAFTSANIAYPALAIDAAGTPYLCYTDNANGSKATVKKYTGGSWVTLGGAALSSGSAQWNALAIDGTNTPYVGYAGVDNKVNVRKFNGTTWVPVGTNSFSAGTASYVSLAISGSGIPYVAYQDAANSSKASVMKFAGTSWTTVGSAGFTPAAAWYTSIAVDINGIPYVAFQDRGTANKASLMKFNGSTWVNSGNPDFSAAEADYTALAVDAGGVPYVAYKDYSVSNGATIMKMAPLGAVTGAGYVCTGSTITLINGSLSGTWSSSNTAVASVSTAGVVTGITAGTAIISYSVSSSCGMVSATKTITVNATSAVAVISGLSTLCTAATTLLTADISAGTWSSSNTAVATIGTSGLLTSVTGGTTIISYVASNGCGITSATKIITVNAVPLSGTITAPSSICLGTAYPLTGSEAGGTWSSANTAIATIDTTGNISGFATGTAFVSYIVTNSCGTSLATAAILVITTPAAATITGSAPLCVDAAITLTPSVTGGSWGSSAPAIATVGSGGLATGISAGAAIITYTITNACGSTATTSTLTVAPLPDAGAVTGGSNVCVAATILPGTSVSGGVWSSSNSSVAATGSAGITGIAAGTATISYSVTNSCGTSVATTIMTVNPAPSAGIIDGAHSVCVAATTTLSSSVTGGTWSSSNTIATVGTSGITSGITFGTCTISYTYSNSCGTDVATIPLTVNPLPDAGTISGIATICTGSSATLTDGAAGTWSSADVSLVTIGGTTGIITGITAGTTSVSYTVTNTCGTAIATRILTINPLPSVSTITGSTSVIVGSTISLSSSITGGTWSAGGTGVSIDLSGIVTGIISGTATISYAAGNSCGTAIATAIVTVTPIPPAPITGSTAVCIATAIHLADAAPGGTWSSSNTAIATIDTLGNLTGSSSGITVVTYTLGTAFVSQSITVNPLPAAITAPAFLCAATTATIADSTTGGTWSSSAPAVATINTSGVLSAISGGTATISYTLATGCSQTAVVTVASPIGIINGSAAVCLGNTTALTDSSAGGAWSSANPAIASISSSGMVSSIATGTTIVSYTLSSGCSAYITVTVSTSLPDITGTSSLCTNTRTTLTNTVTGGTWASSNTLLATIDAATGLIYGIAPGTPLITYSTGGCFATMAVTIKPSPLPITGIFSLCTGAYTLLSDPTPGAYWSSSDVAIATMGSTSSVLTAISTGTAVVSYFTSNGCSATQVITVNSLPSPIAGITTVCPGSAVILSATPTGGTWTSTVPAAATIGSTGIVSGIATGTSIINYSTGLGCNRSATITVNPLPANISGPSALCSGTISNLTDPTTGGTWASSNTSIAAIGSTGIICGLLAGTSTISYTAPTGCVRTTTVTISGRIADIAGAPATCIGLTTPLSDSTSGGVWTSSSTSLASVSAYGVVTGVATGTVNITYTINAGCKTNRTVTINPAMPANTGATSVCLNAVTTLSNTSGGGTWASNNLSLATVDSLTGIVSGLATGTTTITYTIANGCARTTAMTVKPLPVAISGSAALCTGGSTVMVCTTPGGVSWTSSNPLVATIVPVSGLTVGVAPGTTVITYLINTGCFSTKTVTVSLLPSAGTITGPSSVIVGNTIALTNTTGSGTWSSSSSSLATVGSTGVVTGITAGSVNISYSFNNGCGLATTTQAVSVTTSRSASDDQGDNSQPVSFNLYPNPTTSGTFTISTAIPGIFSILSMEGKEVGHYLITENTTRLQLEKTLSGGIYMCRFDGDNGSKAVVRLVYEP